MTDEEFEKLSAKVDRLEEERQKERDLKIGGLKNHIENLERENAFYKALINFVNSIVHMQNFCSPCYFQNDFQNFKKEI